MDSRRSDERAAIAGLAALLDVLPAALDRQLAPTGLTSFEFALIEALHESEAGRLRLTALASRTHATLPRLSRVVTGLERKGMVRRVACEDDGRATNAVLTDAGEDAYTGCREAYRNALRTLVLDDLDDDDLTRLTTLSTAILERVAPRR
jgi:DNA-binding MarR family transcriptional regulator